MTAGKSPITSNAVYILLLSVYDLYWSFCTMLFLYLVSSTEYLALSGRTIYKSLKEADSKAIWYVRIWKLDYFSEFKQEMMRLLFTFFHVQVDAGLAIY